MSQRCHLIFLIILGTTCNSFFVKAFLTDKGRHTTHTRLWNAPPRLNGWKVLSSGSVVGTVTGHPSINDGDVITTSPIQYPDAAMRDALVGTASGSTYQLLEPMSENAPTRYDESLLMGSSAFREAVDKFRLNMRTVGINQHYYLAGQPSSSTSGKSNIWEAYRADKDGVPTEPPLCVKISPNIEAVSREFENYQRLSFPGIAPGRFVECIEYLPVAGYEKTFRDQCALVLEMGARDLKSFLDSRGRLQGKELRDACVSAAQCVQAVHSAGLVWTDIKTENFVVMPDGEVKGIDLESAMPQGYNPVDYSPEACPPEFAKAFEEGEAPYFTLNSSYDVWSLGMLYLELASGKGVFDNKNPTEITKLLRDLDRIPLDDLDADCDPDLRDIIDKCLQVNARNRPSVAQILSHPYFTTSPAAEARYFLN
jgi:serine/threonine protein kinase